MKMTVRWLVSSLVLLCLSSPTTALSQADDKARAGKLFKEGNALRAQEKYGEALERYQEAYKLFKSYKIELNMALALHEMGREAEAAEAYERFLWSGKGKIEQQMMELARGKLAELAGKLGALQVVSPLKKAAVVVDGLPRGLVGNPWPIYLKPGKHQVKVKIEGYVTFQEDVALIAGEKKELKAHLKKQPMAAPKKVGIPEPADESPPLSDTDPLVLKQRRTKTIWAWTTLGVSLACVVGAGVLYWVGSGQSDEAYDKYAALTGNATAHTFDEHWAEVEAADRLYIGGHVLVGFAAAALAVSIYQFVTRPAAERPTARAGQGLRLGMSAGDHGAGLVLTGGF